HYFDEPSSRFEALFSQEQGLLPLLQHLISGDQKSITHDGNTSSFRNAPKQNVGTHPACTFCRWRKRFSLLNDIRSKKVLRDHDEVAHCLCSVVIVDEHQVRIR